MSISFTKFLQENVEFLQHELLSKKRGYKNSDGKSNGCPAETSFKGTVMQIEKVVINDCLIDSKVS